MPITPAHAAAAWPIHRAFRRLPLAALVTGTMAPDLEYVLRMRPYGKFGHTPVGLVAFCLPVTLIVWAVWRAFVRPALTPLLPPAIRAAAEARPPGRATDALPLAAAAALLGAVTHILWDGFTHETGWGVALFPVMRNQAFPGQLWFTLAQYVSSFVGAVIVVVWITREWRRWPAEQRRFEPGQRARLIRAALFVSAFALAMGLVNALFVSGIWGQLGRGIVGTMAGVGIGLVIYAIWAAGQGRVASPR
jgi:hypothetical protein